ncbi:hypothetical protein KZ829_19330 [Actinoplanes hulinensis]|uniref:NAD-dependent epimerase/dehydratase domain-containing protein n=1 Tax=Actinoplanes hulinensis TaxID=1144547 RepID=A0ABS7B4U3_9ACTN|nr:NAD-dependent epimerase/dehydratase family protein [Actinoplanes hulinensis]MBW6435897.1 hypothetical protein [Actinoplanes hulinensis]
MFRSVWGTDDGKTDDSPILVLGGTGTVGSRVAARLRDDGREVRVASRHGEHGSTGMILGRGRPRCPAYR